MKKFVQTRQRAESSSVGFIRVTLVMCPVISAKRTKPRRQHAAWGRCASCPAAPWASVQHRGQRGADLPPDRESLLQVWRQSFLAWAPQSSLRWQDRCGFCNGVLNKTANVYKVFFLKSRAFKSFLWSLKLAKYEQLLISKVLFYTNRIFSKCESHRPSTSILHLFFVFVNTCFKSATVLRQQ